MNRWEGEGVKEIGKEKDTGIVRVKVNEKYFRPTEVVSLRKKKRLIWNRNCVLFIGSFNR